MQEFVTIPTDLIKQSKRGNPFSETDAIMDILTMADEKGELHISIRQLMKRWKWGNTRTVNFIRSLEERDTCKIETRQKQDTVLLINKGFFKGTQDRNKTETRQKQDTKNNEKSNKKEDNLQLFEKLLPDYPISGTLSEKVREWISYKVSKKETYVERGMKMLLKIISKNAQKSGDFAVMDLIDMCMANNWKGIIWEKLETKKTSDSQGKIDWNNV